MALLFMGQYFTKKVAFRENIIVTHGDVSVALQQCYVIVKPHHEEDIFVITRGGAEAEV